MRGARTAGPRPPHPHVRWLVEHLPDAGARATRTFVLASSAEAAAALRDAVTVHRPTLLGVRFVTPAAFVRELSWLLGVPADDDLLPPLGERAVLREVLGATSGEVAAYALRHRTSLGALLATCRRWQRAGMPQPARALSRRAQETLAIAQAFQRALEAHPAGSRGKCVAAVRARLAAGAVPPQRLVVLVTGDLGETRSAADVLHLVDLLCAHAPDTQRADLPSCAASPATTRSVHPSLDAELRAAAHRCALAFAEGHALGGMVVAAPRLGPYVPFLAASFAAEGVPLRAHAETPLAHEPRGALAVHALRLLFDGAPPRSYLALAGAAATASPLPPQEQLALEVQARAQGLSGCTALPERVAQALAESAPAAAAAVQRLAERARAAVDLQGSAARARALRELLDTELVAPAPGSRDAEAAACLHEALDELCHAQPDDFLLDALDVLQGRGLPIGAREGDAVHVVEYADALAFPSTHLTLLGMTEDQLPQATPAPTFLVDDDRQALDLDERASARAREALNLGRLLALPALALHGSRPQVDAQGRPVGPSPLLASPASAALHAIDEAIERAHPLPRARGRVDSGLAPLDAAVTHVALGGGGPADASRLLGARGAAAIKRMQVLERFAGPLTHDGDVGDAARQQPGSRSSVSAIEQLARCAHQFLYRRILGITPLPPEPDALALAPGAVGSSVHDLLAELHDRLRETVRAGEDVEPGALAAELAPRLDARLRATSPLAHTLPGLHRILVRQWALAVARSFADDVRGLRAHGIEPLHEEHDLVGELDLGDGRTLAVRGRADRIDRLSDGTLRVVDYKTGGNPAAVLSTTDILKGRRLQMPAYAAMAEQTLHAQPRELGVRAVRPDLEPDGEFWLRWRYAGDLLVGKHRDALRETLRVLADLREAGTLVPSMDAGRVCRFCDFRAACRRLHPPSRERVYNADRPEVQRYLRLRSKSIHNPALVSDAAD